MFPVTGKESYSRRVFGGDGYSRTSYIVLSISTLALLAAFLVADALAPAGRKLAKITGDDPPVYFDVSHAILFHQSFDLAPEFLRLKPTNDRWNPVSPKTGHRTSPFAIGYSVLALPFLALGTAVDALVGNPADGFSHYAILFYCLTNVVLTALGLMALFAFLYGAASSWLPQDRVLANRLAFLATGSVFFGTSVGYYAFSQMSHAGTFLMGSLFIGWWWKVRDHEDVREWAILGLLAGTMSIIRWQDVLFGFTPILVDLCSGWSAISRRFRSRVVYGLVAGLCWIPQMAEWQFMFGKWLTVPQGDIFVFPPQFILKVMASSEHGWFIWTPLALLGVIGLLAAASKDPSRFIPWLIAIALQISLIASIPVTWHSGPSFSNRYMTSSAPAVALGVLYLLCCCGRTIRRACTSLALACSLFSLLFALQFRLDLIPKLDRLTPSELFADKLRIPVVRHRKMLALQAEELLSSSVHDENIKAISLLESVQVPDRDILCELVRAYKVAGRPEAAEKARLRLVALLDTRLF